MTGRVRRFSSRGRPPLWLSTIATESSATLYLERLRKRAGRSLPVAPHGRLAVTQCRRPAA